MRVYVWKKKKKLFCFVSALVAASVERVGVSRMRDFFLIYIFFYHATSPKSYGSYYPHRSRDSFSPVCGIFVVVLFLLPESYLKEKIKATEINVRKSGQYRPISYFYFNCFFLSSFFSFNSYIRHKYLYKHFFQPVNKTY